MLTSTPNLRFIRSIWTSRWASPIPYITVSWVSSERSIRSVGSSSLRRDRAVDSLSSSPLVFGVIANASSGSGISIGDRVTASSLVENVSPVVVCASFATAAISPAGTSESVSCSLPRSANSWPIRSSVPFVALNTDESGRIVPENTRNIVMWPTYGSETVLNT